MPMSNDFGKSLGKFVRNLKDPRFLAVEVAKQGVAIMVVNPYGQKVKAYLKAKITNGGTPTDAHGYVCEDGFEYLEVGGKKYRHDLSNDTFVPA